MSASQGPQTSKIVPFDSDEAAQRKSVEGGVSRDGFYYAEDERTARYAGCTHVKCADCNTLIPKARAVCDPCTSIRRAAEFATLPRQVWDTQAPLVIFETDTYFFDIHSLTYYCKEHSVSPLTNFSSSSANPLYGSVKCQREYKKRLSNLMKLSKQLVHFVGSREPLRPLSIPLR